jgi:ATP-dependent DNA helicase PIF1
VAVLACPEPRGLEPVCTCYYDGLDGYGNTDIQPPTTFRAVLSYVGKYVSKPEKSSTSYTELQAQVLPCVYDQAPLLSFVSRMLNKLIGERDWSAQELSHILLQLPVQNSSRMVVSLDCHPEEVHRELIVLESGEVAAQRSPLRRYQSRLTDTKNGNAALPDLSLFDCLRHWDWLTWRVRSRARPRVINYYPRYLNDPESPTYADYCRVRLMLHHPFVDYADLLRLMARFTGPISRLFGPVTAPILTRKTFTQTPNLNQGHRTVRATRIRRSR